MAWQAILVEPPRMNGSSGTVISVFWYDDADTANTGAGLGPQGSGTATASTDLVNVTGHGLTAGATVVFTSLTGGAGLTVGDLYYVIATGLTANAFAVSRNPAGAAVNITTNYTALTARKVTLPTNVLHNRVWNLPVGRGINDMLPEIDAEGTQARAAYQQTLDLRAQILVGTVRPVP